jgi:hypothetical protein
LEEELKGKMEIERSELVHHLSVSEDEDPPGTTKEHEWKLK